MDLLIKIKSFCILGDIQTNAERKNIILGTFENYEFYGWFIEGKNKRLLIDLLWKTRQGICSKRAFPFVPLSRKKIHPEAVDYEVWFPVLRRGFGGKPDRHLGWSRTSDLSFDLTLEELETIKLGCGSVFSVLCYDAEDEFSEKWRRAKKVK